MTRLLARIVAILCFAALPALAKDPAPETLISHTVTLAPRGAGPAYVDLHAGLVSLGWDDDLVAKCKTVADLKRMAGSYTANSFSFYGTMANNAKGDLDNKRYMFLDAHGRMGFFTIKPGAGDALVLEIKITPEPFFK
jgi:hypothetical protein